LGDRLRLCGGLTWRAARDRLHLMSVTEIIQQIEALPKAERAEVIEYIHRLEEAEVPESFKKGMADIEAGRVVDMETALNEPPPSRR
jgi:predicted transcriptional regulator